VAVLSSGSWRSVLAAAFFATLLALVSCSAGERPTVTTDRLEPTAAPRPTDEPVEPEFAGPERLQVEVIEQFPHDPSAFTQGLELRNGVFLESTGLYGLTQVGDELIQLTWQENTAFYWDAETFTLNREVPYEGDGWGICYDGSQLVMTDGNPELIFRDPASFAEISRVQVILNGQPLFNLNEVECVNGEVWANLWQTDQIVRIDPATGTVTGVVDAFGLAPADANVAGGAVLNGIAWDDSTQSFYITGKLWSTMYRVNFVPAG